MFGVQFGRKTLHKLRSNILRHMLAGSAADPYDTHNPDSPWDSSTDSDAEFGEPAGWYSNSGSSSNSDDDRKQQQQQQQQRQEAAARAFQGVGMVYGALPPESRRTQAALFNARGDSGPRTSVLVASDAVGMGLNLNISRCGSEGDQLTTVAHHIASAALHVRPQGLQTVSTRRVAPVGRAWQCHLDLFGFENGNAWATCPAADS